MSKQFESDLDLCLTLKGESYSAYSEVFSWGLGCITEINGLRSCISSSQIISEHDSKFFPLSFQVHHSSFRNIRLAQKWSLWFIACSFTAVLWLGFYDFKILCHFCYLAKTRILYLPINTTYFHTGNSQPPFPKKTNQPTEDFFHSIGICLTLKISRCLVRAARWCVG